jgi:hypothetical protein
VQTRESFRRARSDLLDVDAALRREHEEGFLLTPVEGDREVVLLGDVGSRLDPDLADDVAADFQAEDLAGAGLGFLGRGRELDPSGLAAAAGQHLSLDDHLPAAELLGRRARLLR